MTIACIAAIKKFTDNPYELIVVDNDKTKDDVIRDDYHVFQPFTWLPVPLMNVYESYNYGAEHATSDRLMFIQNDVFVHERTLNKLNGYLDKWDVAFPQQTEMSRKQVLDVYATPDREDTAWGQRDAGLLAITREAFNRAGGWDERYHNLLGEAGFYQRLDNNGLSWTDRTTAFITHIKAANNLSKDPGLYNEEMAHDSKILKGEV